VPSQTIIQALPYVNWTVLLALAVGSYGLIVVLGRLSDVTRGYLSVTAAIAGLLGLLALLTDTGLPAPEALAISVASSSIDLARRLAEAVFLVAAFASVVAIRRSASGRPGIAGWTALAAGIVTFALAAVGWAGPTLPAVPLVLQYLALAAASGGALGALILGHWYLVTPRLSERPLVIASRALAAVIGLQVALFIVWGAFGTGAEAGEPPFALLTGSAALFVWLRLIVSLAGPAVLSVMAVRTARSRSMESATGLLYIDLAAVVSGTVVAAGLAYSSGSLI